MGSVEKLQGRRSALHLVCVLMRNSFEGQHNSAYRTFTEGTALSGDLHRVVATLFAGHGCAVQLAIHTLAEGAVILFPLLLVGSQLIIHPAAGLGASH